MPFPAKRNKELEAAVLHRMSEGEPLTQIGRDLGFHPTAWREWCRADKALDIAHARARADGFDAIAESALMIANTPIEGEETTTKANGDVEVRRGDMLGHRKLQIETRLKLLAKWDPKRYGDKLDMTVDANVKGSVSYKANIPPRERG